MCLLVQKVACTKELVFTINLSMLSYLSFHFRLRNQKRLLTQSQRVYQNGFSTSYFCFTGYYDFVEFKIVEAKWL